SEVKPFSANDSVGLPHVKVGHRRVLLKAQRVTHRVALFALCESTLSDFDTYLYSAAVPMCSKTQERFCISALLALTPKG
uniref:hypothetical protein n=1 Tax=Granulosicoccus sp. 3-233 TaxID=3417969 RepID=UPI003D33F89A